MLTKYVGNFIVNFTIAALIILGGLGFAVTSDILYIRKFEKMTMHAKLALTVTGALLVIGFVLFSSIPQSADHRKAVFP